MRKWLRWAIIGASALLALTVVYVIFNFLFLDFFVDLWWFDSLSYEYYYLMRIFYRYIVFSVVFLVFFLIFFFNFWIASRYISLTSTGCVIEPEKGAPENGHKENEDAGTGNADKASAGDEQTADSATASAQEAVEKDEEKRLKRLIRLFQSGSLKVYTVLSFLMAFPIAIPFYEYWEDALLFFFGPSAGVSDPDYGIDISFYLFSYPVYDFLQQKLLIVFLLLFVFLLLLYYITSRFVCHSDQALPKGAKIHLVIIALTSIMIQAWGFSLDSIDMLYTDSHEPLFGGPGFLEMWVDFPFIWLTVITFLGTAVSTTIYIYKRKWLKGALVFGALFFMVLGIRNTTVLHEMIGKYIVKPNEVIREKKYIESSVEATLHAYNLTDVTTENFQINQSPHLIDDPKILEALPNIPVWDRDLLNSVYKQIQGFRSYYSFQSVDEDRYTVGGLYQQVHIGARELNLDDLPAAARNWINRHLQYTHGYGVVMTPAAQGGDHPMTWFVRDIPMSSEYGINIGQPRIYYGEEQYDYAIAPNGLGETDHPRDGKNVLTNYEGTGGIPISSILKKALFSAYYKEKNILFSTKINSKSRLMIRRNITEAISTITPFFMLDTDPYIVGTPKGLFWIVDAYTTSDKYPNSTTYKSDYETSAFFGKQFNYIRNSVKIVVDAYNGSIDYYISAPDDPIIRAYRRMYPSLLKDMSEMPEELRTHLRYPRELMSVQMKIYAKYHQTDSDQFYQDEDTWEFAKSSTGPMQPYYLTLDLPNEKSQEFLLVCPMSPIGRDNLRSLAMVDCDGSNYGKMIIYSFPRGQQVYGPSQIEALVNQDSFIAQQLTLWGQAGSQVTFGRMIILPLGKTILYIQPIYLIAESRMKIPELKRIIVSQGDLVAMDVTLEAALHQLDKKISERKNRQQRLPGKIQAPPAPAHDGAAPLHTGGDAAHPAE